jgi:hypothetical protein
MNCGVREVSRARAPPAHRACTNRKKGSGTVVAGARSRLRPSLPAPLRTLVPSAKLVHLWICAATVRSTVAR